MVPLMDGPEGDDLCTAARGCPAAGPGAAPLPGIETPEALR